MNLPFALNSEPVKWVLIVLSSPLWVPFFKALWKEWNDSLRDEGGVLGFAPTTKELAAINRREGLHRSTMMSETWDEYERRRAAPDERRARAAGSPTAARRSFRAR